MFDQKVAVIPFPTIGNQNQPTKPSQFVFLVNRKEKTIKKDFLLKHLFGVC
jgi:hypothetical protein